MAEPRTCAGTLRQNPAPLQPITRLRQPSQASRWPSGSTASCAISRCISTGWLSSMSTCPICSAASGLNRHARTAKSMVPTPCRAARWSARPARAAAGEVDQDQLRRECRRPVVDAARRRFDDQLSARTSNCRRASIANFRSCIVGRRSIRARPGPPRRTCRSAIADVVERLLHAGCGALDAVLQLDANTLHGAVRRCRAGRPPMRGPSACVRRCASRNRASR